MTDRKPGELHEDALARKADRQTRTLAELEAELEGVRELVECLAGLVLDLHEGTAPARGAENYRLRSTVVRHTIRHAVDLGFRPRRIWGPEA